MTLKNLSYLFGVVFLAVGILGFVPGITTDDNLLLGIFEVSTLHNLVHILSGIAAIVGASSSEKYAQLYFRVFGAVYALVAIVGLIQMDTVLGLFDINAADNGLHVFLAIAILAIGFGVKPKDGPVAAARA